MTALAGAHIYSNAHMPYGHFVTGYELVGTVLIVSGMATLFVLPLVCMGLASLIFFPTTAWLAVTEGIVSVVVAGLLMVGMVCRVVPWERWDAEWMLFGVLVLGATLAAALSGHVVRRFLGSSPNSGR